MEERVDQVMGCSRARCEQGGCENLCHPFSMPSRRVLASDSFLLAPPNLPPGKSEMGAKSGSWIQWLRSLPGGVCDPFNSLQSPTGPSLKPPHTNV